MADDDGLDDFFAKKDKSSKKKGKSKSSKVLVADLLPAASTPTPPNEANDNVDQVADQMADARLADNEQSKEKKRSKKKKDGEGGSKRDDDEWNEVKDEVDYSGLRIATKNIAKEAADEAAENAARSEPEYDEDGQIIEKTGDGSSAVWKLPVKSQGEGQDEVEETPPPPAPVPVITEMPNVTGGRYVPPSMRAGGAATQESLAPASMKRGPMRKKVAPNVNSQEDFPTLGAAPVVIDYDVSKFERVRGGGSSQQTSARGDNQRLEMSNMYSALDRR